METGGERSKVMTSREKIKLYRQAAGLSIQELAKESGIRANRLAAIECGEAKPTIGILHDIALALRAKGQKVASFDLWSDSWSSAGAKP